MGTDNAVQKLGNVFVESDDFDATVSFYEEVLQRGPDICDREHGWAQFNLENAKLAVAARGKQAPGNPSGATASLKVGDVRAWAQDAGARGLNVSPVRQGDHESTVSVEDPAGNLILVYSPNG